jgi:hypothetical protein
MNFIKYKNNHNNKVTESGLTKLRSVESDFQNVIDEIERTTADFAIDLSKNSYTQSELENKIRDFSLKNPIALSLTVGYEPYKYNSKEKLYCSYYNNEKNKLEYIKYNYTDTSLETALWYTNPIKNGKGCWTNPYFAKGVQQLVVDYGVPFYIKGDSSKFGGVVSFTISLTNISKVVNKIGLNFSGYATIITRDGDILAHPKTEFLANRELAEKFIKSEPNFYKLKTETEGYFSFFSQYTFEKSLMFFKLLDNSQWVLGLVLTESDLDPHKNVEIRKIINIILILTLLIVFILVIALKIHSGDIKKLWYFSILFSVLILANIIIIWKLNLNMVEVREDLNKQKIVTQTDLNSFLLKRNKKLKKIGQPKSIEIPTGIYLYDMYFINAYDISFNGEIWQRIPDTLKLKSDIAFAFPQKLSHGISVRVKLISKEKVKNDWVYLYNFTAILNMDFYYSKYPLDFRMLNIQLMYPNVYENVILVPDLNSYTRMDPKLKPGINNNIYMPGDRITSSYFSFANIDFNSNLGNLSYNGPSNVPILEFNVLVKRVLATAIVSDILPIVVISIMMFLLLFTLHKVNGELIEGSALSVIQAAGGFLFILLMAHIQLRKTLETPELSYIEMFYIIMYLFVSFISTAILLYVKTSKFSILEYKNNIIVKIGFWPVLFIAIYITTILMLY